MCINVLTEATVLVTSRSMARSLRIEYSGAFYHVMARGNRREDIFLDDDDRRFFLKVLSESCGQTGWRVHAWVLMGNHYHLVLHTRQANLSRLMRHVNGVYTQDFNRRHGVVGHLFQGRFKAILVDRDSYLLALCRYVERNPVAAKLVAAAEDWRWSSCRAHLGLDAAPPWLDCDGLHGHLLGHRVASESDRRRAARRYAALMADLPSGEEMSIWDEGLRQQVFLGDAAFVAKMQALATDEQRACIEVPKRQRKPSRTLSAYLEEHDNRSKALSMAFREGGITMSAMARELGISVSHVSRLIAGVEREGLGDGKIKT